MLYFGRHQQQQCTICQKRISIPTKLLLLGHTLEQVSHCTELLRIFWKHHCEPLLLSRGEKWNSAAAAAATFGRRTVCLLGCFSPGMGLRRAPYLWSFKFLGRWISLRLFWSYKNTFCLWCGRNRKFGKLNGYDFR